MNSNEVNWQDIRLFLAVAEAGSFSAAARNLKLGQPTLSRRIAELEQELGQPLFSRFSQGCQLTALGQKLLPAAKQMAIWSVETMTLAQAPNKVEGRVRITAPPGICFAFLPQVGKKIKDNFPGIQLEVLSGTNTFNLTRGEADISFRTEKPKDNDLICLASFYCGINVYVSEDVANSLSDKVTFQELNWICWSEDNDHLLTNQILKREIQNFKPVFSSNDYNVQVAACCAGLGALALPSSFVKSPLIKGLKALDIDLSKLTTGELHIVIHKRYQHVERVVIVAELLKTYFSEVWPQ
jgi:DNA-binding transcriptional LysR family regulator